jgi:DNA invertase Pin-like site-specific DNA recombinase
MTSQNAYESGTPSKGNFVIYLRVSTKKQGIDGNGIAAQRQACLDHLNGGNWHLAGEYTEQESGAKNNRPELEKALAQCAKEGATLVVAKLDRLARNVAFVSRLMESGIDFVAADQPFANKLTIHIMVAMAEHEREMISQRTKAALAVVKKHGVQLGNPDMKALGLSGREARTVNAQVHAENVYPVIERIRSFGVTTLRGIATELDERKVETPARQAKIDSGKTVFGDPEWHPQQVKQIIDRIEGEE